MTTTTSSSSTTSFTLSPSPTPIPLPNQTACSFDDSALRLPLAVLYLLLFLFGLAGNLFALWVFLFLHVSRNSVRVFLINCAVADLVLLACLPFRVFYHLNGNRWTLGPRACQLVGNLFYMNMYISIVLLGLISLDRYMRLRGQGRGQRGGSMRPWGSWLVCGAVWGLALVGLVPMIATLEVKEDSVQCFHYRQRLQAKGKAYFNGVVVLLFWLVFLMLMVSYANIAFQLLKVSQDKPDLPNAQRYKRTAKKSFFVLFLFVVCFGPYHAFRPVYIVSQLDAELPCDYLQWVDRTNETMLLLSSFNSCLDPVMYFLLSGSVRKTALRVMGQRLGNWLSSMNNTTSNSSTMDLRQLSVPMALPNSGLNTTPRTSICIVNSTTPRMATTMLLDPCQQ